MDRTACTSRVTVLQFVKNLLNESTTSDLSSVKVPLLFKFCDTAFFLPGRTFFSVFQKALHVIISTVHNKTPTVGRLCLFHRVCHPVYFTNAIFKPAVMIT